MTTPSFIHTENAQKRINKIINGINSGIPILLEGPTGTSKTKSAQMACEQNNQKCIILNFSSQTKIEDLLGQMTKCSDEFGGFAFKKGPYTEAYEKGYCLILDEINLAHESVLQSIEGSLDLGFLSFDSPGISTEKIKMHRNFHLIATQNPLTGHFSQKRQYLSTKFLSRFQIINFNTISKDELLEIANGLANEKIPPEIVRNIVDFHFAFANKYNDEIHVFTIREIASTIKSILKGSTPFDSISLYYCDQFDSKKANEIKKWLTKYNILPSASHSPTEMLIATNRYLPTQILSQILKDSKSVLDDFHPVLLIGPDGCGKTNIARWVGASIQAQSKSTKLFVCNQEMTISDIIGRYMPVSLSKEEKENSVPVRWKNGPVIDAMVNGHVLILDQIDTAPSTILERLNSLYDGMGIKDFIFTVQENPEESEVKVHESFRIIATASEEGLKDLSPAFLNRFTIIYVNNQMEELYNQNQIHKLIKFIGRKEKIDDLFLSHITGVLAKTKQPYNISQFTKIVRGFCKLKNQFPSANSLDIITFMLSIVNNGKPRIEHQFADILLNSLKTNDDDKNDPFYFHKASSTRSIMATLIACSVINQHLIMIGKTGLGKTACAMAFAKMTHGSKGLQMISFNGETQLEELFGHFTIEKGDFSLHMGPLSSSMEQGYVFIADELNIADQQIVQSLNVAVEPLPNETIIIPVVGKDILVNEDFFFIGCQNDITMYGRRPLPESFKKKVLLIDYPEPSHDDLIALTRDISEPFHIKPDDAQKTTTLIERIRENHWLKSKPWSLREVRKLYRRTEFSNTKSIISGMTIWHHAAFMLLSSFKPSDEITNAIIDLVAESFRLSPQQKSNFIDDIKADVILNQVIDKLTLSKRSLKVTLYDLSLLKIPQTLQSFWQIFFQASISYFAEPLLFVGPSGFKTFLAKQLSPLSPIAHLHNDSTTTSLIGQLILLEKYQAKLFLLDCLKIFDSYNSLFSDQFNHLRSSIEQNDLRQSDLNDLAASLKENCPETFAPVIDNLTKNIMLLEQSPHTNSMFSNYTSVFKPGLVTKAILQQNSLILKNIAQASPSVLERFNELLSVSPTLTLFEDTSNTFTTAKTRELAHFSQRFRIIGICLPHERRGLSDAMLSRLTEIFVPSYLEKEQADVFSALIENEDRIQTSTFLSMIENASKIFEKLFHLSIPFALSIQIAKIALQWSKIFEQTDLSLLFGFAFFRCAGGLLLTTTEQKAQLVKELRSSQLALTSEFSSLFLNRTKSTASSCSLEPNLELIQHDISQTLQSTISPFSVETNEMHLPKANLFFTPLLSDLIDLIVSMASIKHPLIIEGPNGCGKSSAVSYVAKCVGAKMITLSISQNTTIEDLFGKVEQSSDSETIKFEFRETEFLHAIKADRDDSHITYWIVIEEMHLASAAVLDSLGAIFDPEALSFLLPTGETVSKGHYFIIGLMSKPISHQAIMNTALCYKTTNYTQYEFNEICSFILKNANFKDESKLFCKKIEILNEIVIGSQNRIPVTLRETHKFIKMMRGSENLLNLDHLLEMLFLGRFSDEETKRNAKEKMGFKDTFSIPFIKLQKNDSILNAGDVRLDISKENKDTQYDYAIKSLTRSQRQLFQFMALSIIGKIPLIVQGPTASGKTYIINLFANIINKNLQVIQLNSESASSTLAGSYQPTQQLNEQDAEELRRCFEVLHQFDLPTEIKKKVNKNNVTQMNAKDFHNLRKDLKGIRSSCPSHIRINIDNTINAIDSALQPVKYLRTRADSAIVKALVNGDWLLLDGIEAAPADLFDRIFTLLDDEPTLNLYERGKGYSYSRNATNPQFKISPEFRLFMTYNPIDRKSTNNISPSFLSRCAIFTLDPIDSTIIDSSLLLDGLLTNIRFKFSSSNTDCAVRLARVHQAAKKFAKDQTLFLTGRSLVYLSKTLNQYLQKGPISLDEVKQIIRNHYGASSEDLMNSEDFITEILKKLKKSTKKVVDELNEIRETSSKYCIAMENMITEFTASIMQTGFTEFPFRDFIFNLPKLQLKDVQNISNRFSEMANLINHDGLLANLTAKQQLHLASINTLNLIMINICKAFETVMNDPKFENVMIGSDELEIQDQFKMIITRINCLFFIVQNRYFIPYIPEILVDEGYALGVSHLLQYIQDKEPIFSITKQFLNYSDFNQHVFQQESSIYKFLQLLLSFDKNKFKISIVPKKVRAAENSIVLIHNEEKTKCISLKVVQNNQELFRKQTTRNGFPLQYLLDVLHSIYIKCFENEEYVISSLEETTYQPDSDEVYNIELNLDNLWMTGDDELEITPLNKICGCLFTQSDYPKTFFIGIMKTFYLIAYEVIVHQDLTIAKQFISWMNDFFNQFSQVKSFSTETTALFEEIKTFLNNEKSLKVIEQIQNCLNQFPYSVFDILDQGKGENNTGEQIQKEMKDFLDEIRILVSEVKEKLINVQLNEIKDQKQRELKRKFLRLQNEIQEKIARDNKIASPLQSLLNILDSIDTTDENYDRIVDIIKSVQNYQPEIKKVHEFQWPNQNEAAAIATPSDFWILKTLLDYSDEIEQVQNIITNPTWMSLCNMRLPKHILIEFVQKNTVTKEIAQSLHTSIRAKLAATFYKNNQKRYLTINEIRQFFNNFDDRFKEIDNGWAKIVQDLAKKYPPQYEIHLPVFEPTDLISLLVNPLNHSQGPIFENEEFNQEILSNFDNLRYGKYKNWSHINIAIKNEFDNIINTYLKGKGIQYNANKPLPELADFLKTLQPQIPEVYVTLTQKMIDITDISKYIGIPENTSLILNDLDITANNYYEFQPAGYFYLSLFPRVSDYLKPVINSRKKNDFPLSLIGFRVMSRAKCIQIQLPLTFRTDKISKIVYDELAKHFSDVKKKKDSYFHNIMGLLMESPPSNITTNYTGHFRSVLIKVLNKFSSDEFLFNKVEAIICSILPDIIRYMLSKEWEQLMKSKYELSKNNKDTIEYKIIRFMRDPWTYIISQIDEEGQDALNKTFSKLSDFIKLTKNSVESKFSEEKTQYIMNCVHLDEEDLIATSSTELLKFAKMFEDADPAIKDDLDKYWKLYNSNLINILNKIPMYTTKSERMPYDDVYPKLINMWKKMDNSSLLPSTIVQTFLVIIKSPSNTNNNTGNMKNQKNSRNANNPNNTISCTVIPKDSKNQVVIRGQLTKEITMFKLDKELRKDSYEIKCNNAINYELIEVFYDPRFEPIKEFKFAKMEEHFKHFEALSKQIQEQQNHSPVNNIKIGDKSVVFNDLNATDFFDSLRHLKSTWISILKEIEEKINRKGSLEEISTELEKIKDGIYQMRPNLVPQYKESVTIKKPMKTIIAILELNTILNAFEHSMSNTQNEITTDLIDFQKMINDKESLFQKSKEDIEEIQNNLIPQIKKYPKPNTNLKNALSVKQPHALLSPSILYDEKKNQGFININEIDLEIGPIMIGLFLKPLQIQFVNFIPASVPLRCDFEPENSRELPIPTTAVTVGTFLIIIPIDEIHLDPSKPADITFIGKAIFTFAEQQKKSVSIPYKIVLHFIPTVLFLKIENHYFAIKRSEAQIVKYFSIENTKLVIKTTSTLGDSKASLNCSLQMVEDVENTVISPSVYSIVSTSTITYPTVVDQNNQLSTIIKLFYSSQLSPTIRLNTVLYPKPSFCGIYDDYKQEFVTNDAQICLGSSSRQICILFSFFNSENAVIGENYSISIKCSSRNIEIKSEPKMLTIGKQSLQNKLIYLTITPKTVLKQNEVISVSITLSYHKQNMMMKFRIKCQALYITYNYYSFIAYYDKHFPVSYFSQIDKQFKDVSHDNLVSLISKEPIQFVVSPFTYSFYSCDALNTIVLYNQYGSIYNVLSNGKNFGDLFDVLCVDNNMNVFWQNSTTFSNDDDSIIKLFAVMKKYRSIIFPLIGKSRNVGNDPFPENKNLTIPQYIERFSRFLHYSEINGRKDLKTLDEYFSTDMTQNDNFAYVIDFFGQKYSKFSIFQMLRQFDSKLQTNLFTEYNNLLLKKRFQGDDKQRPFIFFIELLYRTISNYCDQIAKWNNHIWLPCSLEQIEQEQKRLMHIVRLDEEGIKNSKIYKQYENLMSSNTIEQNEIQSLESDGYKVTPYIKWTAERGFTQSSKNDKKNIELPKVMNDQMKTFNEYNQMLDNIQMPSIVDNGSIADIFKSLDFYLKAALQFNFALYSAQQSNNKELLLNELYQTLSKLLDICYWSNTNPEYCIFDHFKSDFAEAFHKIFHGVKAAGGSWNGLPSYGNPSDYNSHSFVILPSQESVPVSPPNFQQIGLHKTEAEIQQVKTQVMPLEQDYNPNDDNNYLQDTDEDEEEEEEEDNAEFNLAKIKPKKDIDYEDTEYQAINEIKERRRKKPGNGADQASLLVDSDEGNEMTDQELIKTLIDQSISESMPELEFSESINYVTYETLIPSEYSNINHDNELTIPSIFSLTKPLTKAFIDCLSNNDEIMDRCNDIYASILVECTTTMNYKQKASLIVFSIAYANALTHLRIPYSLMIFGDEEFHFLLKKLEDNHDFIPFQRLLDVINVRRRFTSIHEAISIAAQCIRHPTRKKHVIFTLSDGLAGSFHLVTDWRDQCLNLTNVAVSFFFLNILQSLLLSEEPEGDQDNTYEKMTSIWTQFGEDLQNHPGSPTTVFYDNYTNILNDPSILINKFIEIISKFPPDDKIRPPTGLIHFESTKPDIDSFIQQAIPPISEKLTEEKSNVFVSTNDDLEIKDSLDFEPPLASNETFCAKFNGYPKAFYKFLQDELPHFYDNSSILDLNSYLFIPNKASQYSPSSNGTIFYFPGLVKFLLTNGQDTKIFLDKKSGLISSYSVFIVIDCTTSSFAKGTNEIAFAHAVQSVFSLLTTLSHIDLPSLTIIATSDRGPVLLCNGESTFSVLSSSSLIWPALFQLFTNSHYENHIISALSAVLTLRMQQKTVSSVCFVFSDGNYSSKTCGTISELTKSIETYKTSVISICIGNEPTNATKLARRAVWSPNPKYLSKGIATLFEKENPDLLQNIHDLFYCTTELIPINSINRIESIIHQSTQLPFDSLRKELDKVIRRFKKFKNFYNAEQENIGAAQSNPEGDQFDLGKENKYDEQSVLFCMFWDTCLGQRESPDITIDVLKNGLPDNYGVSVVNALNDLGMSVEIVQDYESGIKRIISGQFSQVHIICGRNDGRLPNGGNANLVHQFVLCCIQYWKRGGGLVFWTDNEPFVYELNLFLENVQFDNFGSTKLRVGGNDLGNGTLKSGSITNLKAKHVFNDERTIQCEGYERPLFNYNLVSMYEGITVAHALDPTNIEPFHTFSISSQGGISAMYYASSSCENDEGDIVIDCGFSKLFRELSEEGISRYIKNIAVWMLSIEKKEVKYGNTIDPLKYHPPAFEFFYPKNEKWQFDEFNINNAIDVVFLIDGTESMDKYIESVANNCKSIANYCKNRSTQNNFSFASVIFRDYAYAKGVNRNINRNLNETRNFTKKIQDIKHFLSNVKARGGGGDGPEDWVIAFEDLLSLNWREKSAKVVIFITDSGSHGISFGAKSDNPWDEEADKKLPPLIEEAAQRQILFHCVDGHYADQSFQKAREIYKMAGGPSFKIEKMNPDQSESLEQTILEVIRTSIDEAIAVPQ